MHCITPIRIRQNTPQETIVSCGYCLRCRKKRSSEWAFRLKQEQKRHIDSYFVTLTYSDDNIRYGAQHPTLVKSDLQKYIKRVRKEEKNQKIKYYAVGEYGSKTKRPHYHIIIFSATFETLVNKWQYGNVYIGDVNDASIQYVTGYIIKPKISRIKDRGIQEEFSVMSKGLGDNYMTPQMIRHHHHHLKGYVNDGRIKKPMPRYYKDRIYTDYQYEIIKGKYADLRSLDEDTKDRKTRRDRVLLDQIKFRTKNHSL